jgi:uncharacterized delta-60 repeat protein
MLRTFLHYSFSLNSSRASKRKKSPRKIDHRSLEFESLEKRRLLSVAPSMALSMQAAAVTVSDTLSVDISPASISENGGTATGTVTRDNGDVSEAMTVNLVSSDTSEATVPFSVTIPAGQASATFPISAADDALLDGTQSVTITTSASGGEPFGLDDTFGNGGIASTSLSLNGSQAVAVQPDGKIVAAAASPVANTMWRITRLNGDGSVDATFGVDGIVDTTFPVAYPDPSKIVIQPDGKILVGGKISLGVGSAALARYNADGSLDTTFGGGGVANLSGITGWIEDLEVRPDGKIMLAIAFNGTVYFRTARLNPNGSLDASYGDSGVLTLSSINSSSREIILQPNGHMILAGDRSNSLIVTRLEEDGSIDASFATDGVRSINFGGSYHHLADVKINADGQIILGGFVSNGTGTADFIAARLNPDSSLDSTFSSDGMVTTDFNGLDDAAYSMVVQEDGKIVLAGKADITDVTSRSAMVRYDTGGSLDPTFDNDGLYQEALSPESHERIGSITKQTDGKLVALYSWVSDYRVARFHLGGQLQQTSEELNVTDDDIADFTVTETDGGSIVSEAVTTDTFAVALDAGPLTDVVITVTSTDIGEAIVQPAVLTFTSTDWDIPQTVTVTGVNDGEVDGDQTVPVILSIDDANSDDTFDALLDKSVSITVTDIGLSTPTTYVSLDGTNNLLVEDIEGVDTNDVITISILGANIRVHDPSNLVEAGAGAVQVNVHTVDVPIADITGPSGIIIETLGGDDALIIDFSGGDFSVPIRFEGGETVETDGDELILQGGGTFADATYYFNNVSSGDPEHGTIDVAGNATITYTGLEPISSTISASDVTFHFSDAAETITVTDASGGPTTVDSDTAGESVTFNHPTGTLTVNTGGTSENIVNIDSLAADYPAGITIDGGTGVDTVNFNGVVSLNNKDLTITADALIVNAEISTSGGDVNLSAAGDITLNDTVATGGGAFTIDADNDGNGSGTFTMAAAVMTEWSEDAMLRASDAQDGDRFGGSVSISGDTAIVGAFYEGGEAAFVFSQDANGAWTEQAILRASDSQSGDNFGRSVCIFGDTAIVGAHYEDGGAGDPLSNSGAVYVFTRDVNGAWTEQAILRASNAQAEDYFGYSVSISGDTVIVGAADEDGVGYGLAHSGAAYVFTRDAGGEWTEQAILRASDAQFEDYFGNSVCISGDTVVVGAVQEDGGLVHPITDSGSAYVFTRDAGGVWTEQAILRASDAQFMDFFGRSVSISGDTVVVGATGEDGGAGDPLSSSGATYLFTRDAGGAWTEQAILRASDAQAWDYFGRSISISGDTVIVGAADEDGGPGDPLGNSGAVYMFTRDEGGAWTEQAVLRASDAQPGDLLGYSVSISGDTVFAGAHREDGGPGDPLSDSGAAYVFEGSADESGGSVVAGVGDISITAADVNIGADLSGTGTLTITPSTVASTIGLGGALGALGALNLDDAELSHLVDGFSSITIGDTAAGTGAVDVDSATFLDPVTIAGGTIKDHNGIDLTAPSVTLDGNVSAGQSPGTLVIDGDYAFSTESVFTVEINETTPGTGYDQISVMGDNRTIALNGVELSLAVNTPLELGSVFVIVDAVNNNATHNGLFIMDGTLLNNGDEIIIGDAVLTINYYGTGDVTLTVTDVDEYDFGDAPDPNYPTMLTSDGARHIPIGPMLGTVRDSEPSGQPTASADGDDLAGLPDDEDGLMNIPLLAPGILQTPIDVHVTGTGYLNAWIDFDGSGSWESGERIATDIPVADGLNSLLVDVPVSVALGQTYARLRLTSYDPQGTMLPTGAADDGEVEDYALTIENDVYLRGTASDDTVRIWPGTPGVAQHRVQFNGVDSYFDASVYDAIYVDGLSGTDTLNVYGKATVENAAFNGTSAHVSESTVYDAYGQNFENIYVFGGGGVDAAQMLGSTGNDNFYIKDSYSYLRGNNNAFLNYAGAFNHVSANVFESGGTDTTYAYDSVNDDIVIAGETQTTIDFNAHVSPGVNVTAQGFGRVDVYGGNGGTDQATLYGSTGADAFTGRESYSYLSGNGGTFVNFVKDFTNVIVDVTTGGGVDTAILVDSSSNDRLDAGQVSVVLDFNASGPSDPNITANGFPSVDVYAMKGGDDTAYFTGSSGNDRFTGRDTYGRMKWDSATSSVYASGFDYVEADLTDSGGIDIANLYDSPGDDTLTAGDAKASLDYHTAPGTPDPDMVAIDFDQTYTYATKGGTDQAILDGSVGNDRFTSKTTYGIMQGPTGTFFNYATGFDHVIGDASLGGGTDKAFLYDSTTDDLLTADPTSVTLDYDPVASPGVNVTAAYFNETYTYSQYGGVDTAVLNGSANADRFTAQVASSYLKANDDSYYNYVTGFDVVNANAIGAGDIAFLYDSDGNDILNANSSSAAFSLNPTVGTPVVNSAAAFDQVYTYASGGGTDKVYLDGTAGADSFIGDTDWGILRSTGTSDYFNYVRYFDEVFADPGDTDVGNDLLDDRGATYALNPNPGNGNVW